MSVQVTVEVLFLSTLETYRGINKVPEAPLLATLLPWQYSQITGWLSRGPAQFISHLCFSRLNFCSSLSSVSASGAFQAQCSPLTSNDPGILVNLSINEEEKHSPDNSSMYLSHYDSCC